MICMELVEGTPFPKIFQYEWDGDSKNCLLQGDIIGKDVKLFGEDADIVGYLIISNSCDLEHNNTRKISLAPIYPIDVWFKENSFRKRKELKDLLYEEVNYGRKLTFFISPLSSLENIPSIAYLDDIRSVDMYRYIFNWQNVPGSETESFINFLNYILKIEWVKTANVEKIDEGNVISVSTERNTLFLVYKKEEDKNEEEATLVIDDGRINKLKAATEDDKLLISFRTIDLLLINRLCSLKSPWREQLGHKVGNIFNRISTYTPPKDRVKSWADSYNANI